MTIPAGGLIAIDTSVLVSAFDPAEPRFRAARGLLDAVRNGHVRSRVSVIAAAEAAVRPLARSLHMRASAIQAFLLTVPNVELSVVTWGTALEAARIRAEHGIQLPDAIILASAAGCDALASADKRALTVARAEGIETLPF